MKPEMEVKKNTGAVKSSLRSEEGNLGEHREIWGVQEVSGPKKI